MCFQNFFSRIRRRTAYHCINSRERSHTETQTHTQTHIPTYWLKLITYDWVERPDLRPSYHHPELCAGTPLPPAIDHKRASSRARFKAVDSLGVATLKTQSFRCFQMVKAPRMMRELNPFRASPLTVKTALSHQASKEESTTKDCCHGAKLETDLPSQTSSNC